MNAKAIIGGCLTGAWLAFAATPSAALDIIKLDYVAISGLRLANPYDLALSLDKSLLFVSDLGNNRVKILDPKTLKTIDVVGQNDLSGPYDVAVDNRGRLVVADSGNNRIVFYRIFGTKGRKVDTWSGVFAEPRGVGVGPDDAVYVTNVGSHEVMKFVNGRHERTIGGLGHEAGQFNQPHDINFDSRGRVYIADSGNNRIQILDKDLNFIDALKGSPFNFNNPRYFKIDDRDWLYVADGDNHQIKIFDDRFIHRSVIGLGVPGRKRGQLRKPEGVEVWGDDIWISDTHNSRIMLYRR